MKRRVTLSVVLTLGALLALTAATVRLDGQQRRSIVADSGVVTLGPNQVLRISGDGVDQDDVITLRFRRIEYTQTSCTDGVCMHDVSSDTTSPPMTLAPNEAVSLNILTGSTIGRGIVSSNNANIRIMFQIVDTTTGSVQSVWGATTSVH